MSLTGRGGEKCLCRLEASKPLWAQKSGEEVSPSGGENGCSRSLAEVYSKAAINSLNSMHFTIPKMHRKVNNNSCEITKKLKFFPDDVYCRLVMSYNSSLYHSFIQMKTDNST